MIGSYARRLPILHFRKNGEKIRKKLYFSLLIKKIQYNYKLCFPNFGVDSQHHVLIHHVRKRVIHRVTNGQKITFCKKCTNIYMLTLLKIGRESMILTVSWFTHQTRYEKMKHRSESGVHLSLSTHEIRRLLHKLCILLRPQSSVASVYRPRRK